MMARKSLANLFVILQLGTLLNTFACPYCTYPTPPLNPPPPPLPPKAQEELPCPPPPHSLPPPPLIKSPPPPPRPVVKSPPPPPPFVKSPPPPPPPPVVKSPPPPSVPYVPPVVKSPPPPAEKPCPPPPPATFPPPPPRTCPIDTLKLGACVDLLGGLIHIGIGGSANDHCCPLLKGVADLDAALCLCTTIKARILNINLVLPIALQVLLDCGKHLPSDFTCPS